MMKVETYLINLDGSDQRLASATAQLQQEGWPFTRFSAYDGRGKALAEFKQYDDAVAQRILGRSLINSELGCYLSHYGCAEKAFSGFQTEKKDYRGSSIIFVF
jgi:glycosyl transferase family 25